MRGAKAEPRVVHPLPQQQGIFTADVAAARTPAPPPLLRYALPAHACALPLQVRMQASVEALAGEGQVSVLVSLQSVLSSQPGLHYGDLTVHVVLPTLLELPVKVSPKAHVDGGARQLQWCLSGMYPGRCDCLAALFVVSAGKEACRMALQRMTAEVRLSGMPGASCCHDCCTRCVKCHVGVQHGGEP